MRTKGDVYVFTRSCMHLLNNANVEKLSTTISLELFSADITTCLL